MRRKMLQVSYVAMCALSLITACHLYTTEIVTMCCDSFLLLLFSLALFVTVSVSLSLTVSLALSFGKCFTFVRNICCVTSDKYLPDGPYNAGICNCCANTHHWLLPHYVCLSLDTTRCKKNCCYRTVSHFCLLSALIPLCLHCCI